MYTSFIPPLSSSGHGGPEKVYAAREGVENGDAWFRPVRYCALWKWEEREVAGDCFPGKEARWSLGTMCACVIAAGEVQSWYHRPLGRRSDNGLHSRAKVASAPGARLRSSFLVTMYGMTGL